MLGAIYYGEAWFGFAQGQEPMPGPSVVVTLACVSPNAQAVSCVVEAPAVVSCAEPAS